MSFRNGSICLAIIFCALTLITPSGVISAQSTHTVSKVIATNTLPPKFLPPPGRILFIIGQDNDTIGEYIAAIPSPHPGGVTSYTSLNRLEGLTRRTDYGSGTVFLDQLVGNHPDNVIALGLSLVDYLPAIPSDQADHKIDKLLDLLSSYNRPVFLRFGYEFDGEWNHYEPEEYKNAWIYFRNRIQEKNITNITMIWQSATYCDGTYQGQPIEAWYPGDKYVDWLGLSFFTQADCDLRPLDKLLEFARIHNKLVMVAESAPQRYETGKLTYSILGQDFEPRTAEQIWEEWYSPFFAYIYENADMIRAVAYINTYWDTQSMWGEPYPNGYWGDSRVQINEFIKERWIQELNKETWLMASPELFSTLGYSK